MRGMLAFLWTWLFGTVRLMTYVFVKNSIPADRARINVEDPVEVKWWSKFLGCSTKQLLQAVARAGDSAAKVEQLLDIWMGLGLGARSELRLRAA